MTRSNLIQSAGAVALGGGELLRAQAPKAPFTLPPLPYPADALEPHIDARTMELHHDRHHAAYVNNLNAAVVNYPELAGQSAEELMRSLGSVPESVRAAVRNNGGGHVNHSFFWQVMSARGGQPGGELLKAIEKRFGGLAEFKEQFTRAALTVFGSGWVWLALDGSKQLQIRPTPNQDNPWMVGEMPLAALDVWEHAYYLKHQNRRADYIAAWWNVVHWDFVAERFQKLVA